jgi:BioD-like phosphotransacetylase family protein
MNFKNSNAARTTETRDVHELERQTGNIYEALAIIAKRSSQISSEMKEELSAKLQEFATTQDNLEEVFENREQIEISKFYEKLPKPHAIAVQELLDDEIYFRKEEKSEQ